MYDIIKTADEIGNIKPCPFCGNTEHIVVRHDDPIVVNEYGDKISDFWEIECYQCRCLMQNIKLDKLITKWNNRKQIKHYSMGE